MNDPHAIILFDGICNFCNGAVNYVIRADKHDRFRFAPLQSDAGRALLVQYGLSPDKIDSFVLVIDGRTYEQSDAVLKAASLMPFPARMLNWFRWLPRSFRDAVYRWIARNRYKWFGKKDACMVPTPEMRRKFLV
ncbi:thiol-disulfide oxidoreductase DCC family protein [Chitinophaga lutea]